MRKYSGGVHSKSENTCLIMSSLILIAGNWISLYAGWALLELIISGISVLGLINTSPIQNENKLLEASEQIKYKCITAVISCGSYVRGGCNEL